MTVEAADLADISQGGETGVAARYAAALYALAFEQKCLDQVADEMSALGRLISANADLRRLISTPFTDQPSRTALGKALAAQGFSTLVLNFVNVVAANRRLRDLPQLVTGFAGYLAAKRGEMVAKIATAQALTDLQRTQLRARLAQAGFGSVKLQETTNPALLGGLTLKIGTKLYDTSLKSRLDRLNYSLKGAA